MDYATQAEHIWRTFTREAQIRDQPVGNSKIPYFSYQWRHHTEHYQVMLTTTFGVEVVAEK